MQHDVFICHASEDKEDFVRPLAERLRQQHIDVWYDEFSLTVGDSLTQKINEGLASSRFGIVVLSPNFFMKPWAERELNGLTVREMIEKRNLILPVWHRVGFNEVAKYSLSLADKMAVSSAKGINAVIRDLAKKINPKDSPLIVARDHLINLDLNPPPISDEWWLDMVEYKEFLKFPDLNVNKRWIFPLPYPNEENGYERGQNIASTALQSDWSFEGEELNISPTTHPDKVHEFIHRWPGLYDCARANAGVLALYVPQLTIPGFDAGFEDVFDNLLERSNKSADRIFSYGSHNTIDGEAALCGDVIAYRHPTFGNYTIEDLGRWYFYAHDTTYIRSHWELFEGLVWLASSDSNWLPEKYRQVFIKGILGRGQWADSLYKHDNPFLYGLITKSRRQFKFSPTMKAGLLDIVIEAEKNLGIVQNPEEIVQTLVDIDIVKNYYDYRDWFKDKRSR